MDTVVTLKATPRTSSGKGAARRLRAAGQLPAVAYGSGAPTQPIAIESAALKGILTSARGRNTIISLNVDGKDPVDVMVKDYTVHPVSRRLLHADLVVVVPDKPVDCEVPFHTRGKSKGEAAGGTLLSNIRSLTVRCLPSSIPDEIVFDVSALEIDDIVKVKDLTMPENVVALLPPERSVVIVAPPRVMEASADDAAAADGAAAEGGEKAPAGDAS